ncbi:MAG TPA: hypothetical protein VKR81_10710, partial [Candidatus Binatia bacterium]|nr:hypothetical protein [Candidatus Binatia bacterium]
RKSFTEIAGCSLLNLLTRTELSSNAIVVYHMSSDSTLVASPFMSFEAANVSPGHTKQTTRKSTWTSEHNRR